LVDAAAKLTSALAHFCSMCGPKVCSMELTRQVRTPDETDSPAI
jgi:thiamine biosynthesis protein ThiC